MGAYSLLWLLSRLLGYSCPRKCNKCSQIYILSVDSLASFSFLNIPSVLSALKAELPQYVASTEYLAASYDHLQWWKENESVLPTRAAWARKVLVVQPSSAVAERVFSLLKSSFSERQGQSLQDYLETSLMLQYNKHWYNIDLQCSLHHMHMFVFSHGNNMGIIWNYVGNN